jgi:hypothetical protein
MGTSRPKPDAPPASPLIPPWADKDPLPPVTPPDPLPEDPVPEAEEERGLPADEVVDAEDDSNAAVVAELQRFRGFRIALGRFAGSGDQDDARTALGRWANKSVGGGLAGSRRTARAARSGGAALAGIARAAAGQPPEVGALDIRTLAGQPIEVAVGAIVDAFMPPGILDEMAARLAMEQALAVALGSADTFDPAAIDSNAVRIATLAFVAELVFVQVAGDAGRSLASIGPVAAAQRETDIRSLVHAVVDLVGSPVLAAAGAVISEQRMAGLVSQLVRETLEEVATW